MTDSPFRNWYLSASVIRAADLSSDLSKQLRRLPRHFSASANQDLFVATCSELLLGKSAQLPPWAGQECRYLIVMDLPEPAAMRLPSVLNVRRPDQRVHITSDPTAVKRLVLALLREHAWETIVDAYVLDDRLVAVLGDLTIREFPRRSLPRIRRLSTDAFGHFELDSSGSYLYWPDSDVHLGPSQMIQAVDPTHLADIEIRRYALDKTSSALLAMRDERGLNQGQIDGLSERHVRRLENEEARLTADASKKYARTFGLSLDQFLGELSRKITSLRDDTVSAELGSARDEGENAYG